jgi:hypothetical protein
MMVNVESKYEYLNCCSVNYCSSNGVEELKFESGNSQISVRKLYRLVDYYGCKKHQEYNTDY